ncbi:hypothetical protein C7212DRAFT_326191 [Tuber magnatum]|uniref:Uncharacterized protein n=1 Tax=Tuber magnatum TaxID=42249 RepID=A0A317SNA5_9PEZI|nr:hypothetical protein C7212DRAFT_326191 [Tuber magnatum]
MARETQETHNHYSYPPGRFAVGVTVSPVPVIPPPHPGQQGYWMVPLPTAPGALPGQPTEWAPVVAYGWVADSHQGSIPPPPPLPSNPEWVALDNEAPIPIDEPTLSIPLSSPAPDPLPPVEGQVMVDGHNQGKEYNLLPPPPSATAPDSAAVDQGQAPPGHGQGVDWFVVPIPAPPGNEGEGLSDGPGARNSDGDGGEASS